MINRVAVCIIIVLYIHDTERGLLMEKLKTFDVDLKRLFFEILKRLWLILLVGIVCGSGVFLYAKFFITYLYSELHRRERRKDIFIRPQRVPEPGYYISGTAYER